MNEEKVKMAKSLVPMMILGWVMCFIGLVAEPYVLVKARELRKDPTLLPEHRGKVDVAYYGALVYCVLAALSVLGFAVMTAISAMMSNS